MKKSTITNIIIGVLVLVLLGLIIAGIVCACKDSEDDAPTSESFHNKGSVPFKRPHHPPWYKDIPETHSEVKQLQKETEIHSKTTPTFTPHGYEKIRMPEEIFKYLTEVCDTTDRIKEDNRNIFRRTSSGLPPYIIPIPESRKKWIHTTLKPILEEWCGFELHPTAAYGPREYRRGSSLRMHVDRETHIISAILHIGRDGMDEDWPLVIINRKGERERIFMKPGDMVLYESASLPHSREEPLKGDFYRNIFIHYQPQDLEWFKNLKKNLKK